MSTTDRERRHLLLMGAAAGAGLLAVACGGQRGSSRDPSSGAGAAPHREEDEDVAPPEDLMREHGVLNRILLVYEEGVRRLEGGGTSPAPQLIASATIIRRFIEDYHEKLEEDFLFPRFEKAGKLVDLVGILRGQHRAGRKITDEVLRLLQGGQSAESNLQVAAHLRSFIRMYRPHEAREDTVLFPALRSVVSLKEFHELGERFEEKEHALFGKEGFEGIVVQVASIEQQLGIADLAQFTPS